MQRARLGSDVWILAGVLMALSGACGDPAVDGGPLDFGRPDLAPPMVDAEAPWDMRVLPDAALGQPCTDALDCPSGYCVALDDGTRACSERCGRDDDCPPGWLCRQVSNAGPDVTFICVPEMSPCGGADLERDPDNCGACGEVCAYAFAEAVCDEGSCAMGGCLEGHVDLDGDAGNGCEYGCVVTRDGDEACDEIDNDCDGALDEGFDLSADPSHCGACGVTCSDETRSIACVEGDCSIGDCLPGRVDADGEPGNGCELRCEMPTAEVCDARDNDCDGRADEGFDLATDAENCGACGVGCAFANADATCVDGACQATDCRPGFVDLDGMPGCEYACAPRGDELCDRVDDDCDGAIDEAFDLDADPVNCGACGVECSFANAAAECVAGRCAPGPCEPGFVDLDGIPGCEYACAPTGDERCDTVDNDCDGRIDEGFDLEGDRANCGRCGRVCAAPAAIDACVDGDCALIGCQPGFVDLDRAPGNGCEYACAATGAERCDAADNDCDGVIDEGFVLDVDPANCGACGRVCDAPAAETTCVAGDCRVIGCDEGFVDLDDDPESGCEYACVIRGDERCDQTDEDCDGAVDEGFDLSADPAHCGACGEVCGFLNAAGLCVEGDCEPGPCEDGFVDLDGAPGCEYACTPTPDRLELCNEVDDDCDGRVDERAGEPPLPDCALDRSGVFLVQADPDTQLLLGLLEVQFTPAFLTLEIDGRDVDGSMDGPDGRPILYSGEIDGDAMSFTGAWAEPLGTVHNEVWEVVWEGADRFTGLMTDRFSIFGQPSVLVWNVVGTRR